MICWQDAHNQSEDSSCKNKKSRMIISNFFMMNKKTPHLGARSGLMSNESSNQRRQPGMGTALAFESRPDIQKTQTS